MPNKPSIKTIQAKADKAMSLYIRQKYSNYAGAVRCVSCGRIEHWTNMDCGHFIPKSRGAAIRYVEENVHPECKACNRFDEGHLIGYTRYMIEMYGDDKIDELKSEARRVCKPSERRKMIEEALTYYTEALIDLMADRNSPEPVRA